MKRETLDHFLGREVTIKFFDNEIAKGILELDKYKMKNYLLKTQTLNEHDISFKPSHVKSIGSAGLYEQLKEQK